MMVQHHYIQSEGFSTRGHESMLLDKFIIPLHMFTLDHITPLIKT